MAKYTPIVKPVAAAVGVAFVSSLAVSSTAVAFTTLAFLAFFSTCQHVALIEISCFEWIVSGDSRA